MKIQNFEARHDYVAPRLFIEKFACDRGFELSGIEAGDGFDDGFEDLNE